MEREAGQRGWRRMGFDVVVFAGSAAQIAWLYERPVVLAGALLCTTAVAFAVWRDVGLNACIFLVGAVVGAVGETVGVWAGAWRYARPSFLGIPVWLPVAWGLVVALVVQVATAVRAARR